MTQKKRIAIIGAGFCGLAVAWHLSNHVKAHSSFQIDLIDSKGIGKGTSGIAAGLLHPFAGAHAKLNWRGKEGFVATQELLHVASKAIGRSVIAKNQGILRLAITNDQLEDFQLCAEKYPEDTEWLDAQQCLQFAPGIYPYPGLLIRSGITVYSSLYLQGLWHACQQKGVRFKNQPIQSLKELDDYDTLIVTAGAETKQIQELASLPIHAIKGQVLELSWPKPLPPLPCALNSHVYILMSESNTNCLIGATYERAYSSSTADTETAVKELLPKAIELFPPLKEASVLNCYSGLRAVTPHHRPIIKCLNESHWVLTGMGSKGLLYHALFAKELVQQIYGK